MSAYTIAASHKDLVRNLGVEVIASSVPEAVARYMVIDGAVGYYDDSIWIRKPNGEIEEIEIPEPEEEEE